jgi:hypothetical protein
MLALAPPVVSTASRKLNPHQFVQLDERALLLKCEYVFNFFENLPVHVLVITYL